MILWQWRSFDALTKSEFYDILALRQEIFVIEQNCLYQDLDYKDQQAIHLLGIKNGQLVAYLRLFLRGELYANAVSFGRVLIKNRERGQGFAKQMMQEVLTYVKNHEGDVPLKISAQAHLLKFYSSFGFEVVGAPYLEDGISHIKMQREIKICSQNY